MPEINVANPHNHQKCWPLITTCQSSLTYIKITRKASDPSSMPALFSWRLFFLKEKKLGVEEDQDWRDDSAMGAAPLVEKEQGTQKDVASFPSNATRA